MKIKQNKTKRVVLVTEICYKYLNKLFRIKQNKTLTFTFLLQIFCFLQNLTILKLLF